MSPATSPACAAARAAEYPHLAGIYLNAASYGPLPARCLEASHRYDERRAAATLTLPDDFGDVLHRARSACARLVGAGPAEITLTPNTSVGLNIAAALVAANARDGRRTVVVPDREFPANVYPWKALDRAGTLQLDIIPVDGEGCPDLDAICARVAAGDVVALSISAVQFATGFRADLARLGRTCREHGALFIVDGIQAVGAVPVDVKGAGVDVLACGGQKWLCSPYGTGFAYIREGLLRAHEPALPGWLSFHATADFTGLLSYEWDLWEDGRRFEVGSHANQAFLGMAHSLELILEIGVDTVFEHVRALQEPIRAWARRTGARIVGAHAPEHASCILPVVVANAAALHATLAAHGVACVQREGAVRFSPHFYNTMAEMERVADILARA
ncbi:MAG TPA: aminotransferase class V-fold PLP-dependent enzyme [Longimicrobiales bacterium]|nr:aminotransferase class V-fold PLP-dependent enzyme [Longimicrobiales bacterium]